MVEKDACLGGGVIRQAFAGVLVDVRVVCERDSPGVSPEFLDRVPPHSTILSAACGAGRYDAMLLEAGHSMVGIVQSAGMLERARQPFPGVRYEKVGLQEMNFRETFDGAICLDALEHVCPEDWPGIMQGFWKALKPGWVLYFTVELPDKDEVEASCERAKAMGLPVVFGELADGVEASYERVMALSSTRAVVVAEHAVWRHM